MAGGAPSTGDLLRGRVVLSRAVRTVGRATGARYEGPEDTRSDPTCVFLSRFPAVTLRPAAAPPASTGAPPGSAVSASVQPRDGWTTRRVKPSSPPPTSNSTPGVSRRKRGALARRPSPARRETPRVSSTYYALGATPGTPPVLASTVSDTSCPRSRTGTRAPRRVTGRPAPAAGPSADRGVRAASLALWERLVLPRTEVLLSPRRARVSPPVFLSPPPEAESSDRVL